MGYLADLPDKVGAEMFVQTLEEMDDGAEVIHEMESA